MKIGFFNSTVKKKQHMSIYAYNKMFESLQRTIEIEQFNLPSYRKPEAVKEKLEEYDVLIVPQVWYGDKTDNYKLIPELKLDAKIIHYIVNGRKKYFGHHQKWMVDNSNAIWCSADYLKPFKQPSWFVPSGCWKEDWKEERESLTFKSKYEVLAPMGRGKHDPARVKALQKFAIEHSNCEIHLTGPKAEWADVILPDNVKFIHNPTMKAFKEYSFVLECASTWCQKLLPHSHWSDRVTFAVSCGAHLITDYQPTLDAFESAISHTEKDPTFVFNEFQIELDRKRHHWDNILSPVIKETLEAL